MSDIIEPDVLCKICHVTILGKYSDPIGDEYPDFICKKCQPDGLNLCAECGDLFIDSDMNWEAYDKGNSYCNQCAEPITSEPQIRKATESERDTILDAIMGKKQDPDVCNHRMVSFHSKSNTDGFDGNYGNLVGKCLECGSIILTHYEMTGDEILTDKEWLESLYEKRNGFRGYGWYEKEDTTT